MTVKRSNWQKNSHALSRELVLRTIESLIGITTLAFLAVSVLVWYSSGTGEILPADFSFTTLIAAGLTLTLFWTAVTVMTNLYRRATPGHPFHRREAIAAVFIFISTCLFLTTPYAVSIPWIGRLYERLLLGYLLFSGFLLVTLTILAVVGMAKTLRRLRSTDRRGDPR